MNTSGLVAKQLVNKKPQKGKTSRLVSYVYPEGAFTDREEDSRHARKRTRVANAGVEKVMQFEEDNLREPVDMEKIKFIIPDMMSNRLLKMDLSATLRLNCYQELGSARIQRN